MIDHTEAPHSRLPPRERTTAERPGETVSDPRREAGAGSAAELFAPLFAHLREFSEYASYYFSARTDLVKAKVRKLVLFAVLGIVAAIAGAAMLVVAVAMLLTGIAGGLGELMGNRPWAGSLATGAILLATVFGALRLMMPHWLSEARKRTKEKYDRRRQSQRTQFGHDVDEIRKNQRRS